jgi:hypothetical protein
MDEPDPSQGHVELTNLPGGLPKLEVLNELGRVVYSQETKPPQVDLHLNNVGLYQSNIKSGKHHF